MASKNYAYYLRGLQLALIEESTSDSVWKSPVDAATNGLELEYAYSPIYRINDIEDKNTAITGYDESSGRLKFTGSGLSTDAAITHIVISGSEKWNGLHKSNTLNSSYWIVETKYNGAAVTETVTSYTDVDALSDEGDTIDLPEYLCKALVYYVKARLAEDSMEIEVKEYLMRQYRGIVGGHESAKIWGARRVLSGPNAIR